MAKDAQQPPMTGRTKISQGMKDMSGNMGDVGLGLAMGQTPLDIAKGMALNKLIGPATLLSATLLGVMKTLVVMVKQTELFNRGLQQASRLQTFESQFTTLLKSVTKARDRIAELYRFAATTPFRMDEIADASRSLEVFTRGAYSTGEGLRTVGDAAAATGNDIRDTAFWIGRLYDDLKNNRPIGASMMALQKMGLISGQTRLQLEALTDSGADFSATWRVIQTELDRSSGAMERQSQTLAGLQSNLQDTADTMANAFGQAFLQQEQDSIKATIAAMEGFTPVFAHMGRDLSVLTGIYSKAVNWLKTPLISKETLVSIYDFMATIATGLGLATLVMGFTNAIRRVRAYTVAMREASAATAGLSVIELVKSLATATAQMEIAGIKTAALGLITRGLAGAWKLASTALLGAGRALLAFAATPVGWITMGITAAVGILKWRDAALEAVDAQDALSESTHAATRKIVEQIRAIKTLDDYTQALINSQQELVDAQSALREAQSKGAPSSELQPLQDRVALAQANVKNVLKIKPTELGPGINELQKIKDRALANVELNERAWDRRIQEADPNDVARLMQQRAAEKELRVKEAENANAATRVFAGSATGKKIDELTAQRKSLEGKIADQKKAEKAGTPSGVISAEDKARLEQLRAERDRHNVSAISPVGAGARLTPGHTKELADLEKKLGTGFDTKAAQKQIDDLDKEIARLTASDAAPIVARLTQQIIDLQAAAANPRLSSKERGGIGQQIAAKQAELTVAQQNIQELENNRLAVAELRAQAETTALRVQSHKIDLDTETRILALQTKGLTLATQTHDLKMAGYRAQLDLAVKTYGVESQAAQEARNRLADEDKSWTIARDRAKEELDAQKQRVGLARAQAEANDRFSRGDIRGGAAALARNRETENALRVAEARRQARNSGDDENAAGALEQQKIDQETAARKLSEAAFRRQKEEQLAINNARAHGDRKGAIGLEDFRQLRNIAAENVTEGGMSPGQAVKSALSEIKAQLSANAISTPPRVVADSLQSIGGGGGANGIDPLLRAQERIASLAARQADLLAEIAVNTAGGGDSGIR